MDMTEYRREELRRLFNKRMGRVSDVQKTVTVENGDGH